MKKSLTGAYCLAIGVSSTFFLCLGVAQDPQPPSETRARAEELWEQAIAAKGGRERLHQVETFAVFFHTERGKFSRRKGKAYEVLFLRLPDKWWSWSDMRSTPLGGSAFLRSAEWGPDSRYDLMRDQLHFLVETRWLRPVPVSARKEVLDGVRVDVVRTQVQEGYDAEFFLDPMTHLPKEVRIGKRQENRLPPWSGFSLSEYAPCQGIQMPRTTKWFELDPGPVSYEINPEYDDAALRRFPRFEGGPEAWRPKDGRKRPIVRCE